MNFIIYQYRNGTLSIDYGPRDESNGVIGAVTDLPQSLATADSLDAATKMAYAHLVRHPDAVLYITDSNRLLYEIAINRQYQSERSASSKSLFVAWTCVMLCILSFVFTLISGIGFFGLLFLALAFTLYLSMVRFGIFNEVESAAVVVILAILIAFLIPVLQKAWSV